jgi:hypothetical protein
MKNIILKICYNLFAFFICMMLFTGFQSKKLISLKKECTRNLLILADDLIRIQNLNTNDSNFGALYCKACSSYHTRASESVLPFAVAYKQSREEKYLTSALAAGNWLEKQQQKNGSWLETPDTWTGTTTDQLLSMSAAYPILKEKLSKDENDSWKNSIKAAADWLVQNMDQEFASINYCATTTASLMLAYQIIPDPAYKFKAEKLALDILPKFDEDYFLTGEGNRIRGTKYGIDLGYDLDMSLWGLGLYAKLSGDEFVNDYVKESLKRMIYFIYPDGSIDDSWGVRSSKWTTYGSFTADGSQILFSLYCAGEPPYRGAALSNLNYFMKMRVNGLLTYGPGYSEIFNQPPCIYPTFARAKNLALAILFGDQKDGNIEPFPSQKTGWIKYFKTINTALVRTKNFMATITGYRYKDIRRGSNFKYMFRPSGGSITNLWVKDYGYLQASSQTEYHKWEMNYPEIDSLPAGQAGSISITPRIEFSDSNAYYTNLFEFDSHMDISEKNGIYSVESFGELKDKNRWEGGVAYVLTNIIADNFIQKNIKLRFHGQNPEVRIVEPFIQKKNTIFKKLNNSTIEISDNDKVFVFKLLTKGYPVELGTDEKYYKQPFPSLKGYPVIIKVKLDDSSFIKEISYSLTIKDN